MAKLPGLTEYYATLGAPAINFGRGLLGYQDPVGTETMQNRMTEIEAGRTKGNVGYEDYGLTPVAGRMVGGLPELAVNNPTDFALAGSIGKYDFSPEGRTGLNYDFTPDQDTGSTGNAMLDYVNSGGVRNSLSNLRDSFSNMGSAQASEMPVGPMSNANNTMTDASDPFRNKISENIFFNQDSVNENAMQVMQNAYNQSFQNDFEVDSPYVLSSDRTSKLDAIDRVFNTGEKMAQNRYNRNTQAYPTTDLDAQYTNDSFQTQPSTRFRDHSNMKSFLQANPDMGKNIKNKIGSVFNQGKQGILNNPLVKGAGMAFNAATGNIPGMIMGGIGMLGNQFADKTLYNDTIDENGNVYSADQLNSQNALGGGYTDPARSARRRVNRIRKMKERKDTDRRYSKNNLRILQEQEAAAQQSRLAATRSMARDNSKDNTGGYQAGYSGSFMGGSGTAADMGSFRDGGLASMFTRRR